MNKTRRIKQQVVICVNFPNIDFYFLQTVNFILLLDNAEYRKFLHKQKCVSDSVGKKKNPELRIAPISLHTIKGGGGGSLYLL